MITPAAAQAVFGEVVTHLGAVLSYRHVDDRIG